METSFSLNEIIKNMIKNNKSLDEICNELNFDRKYIITLLKGIKSDILLSYDCDSFYMLELIDSVLYNDKEISQIAWSKYGFRTGVTGGNYDVSQVNVSGIPQSIDSTVTSLKMNMYEKLISYLGE